MKIFELSQLRIGNSNMKIVFFQYLFLEYGGGTAEYFIDTAREVKNLIPNADVTVVTCNEQLSKRFLSIYSLYFMKNLRKQNLRNIPIKSIHKKLKPASYNPEPSLTQIRQSLSSAQIIYCKNDILELMLLNLLTHNLKSKKVIIGMHTPTVYEKTPSLQARLHNLLYGSILYKLLVKHADVLHVLNSHEEQVLKNRYPNKTVKRIPNPLPSQVYKSYKHSPRSDVFSVLWVGRLTEQKGINDLIKLIRDINSSTLRFSVRFTVIGDGEYAEEMRALRNKWNNVTVHGHIQREKLLCMYADFDLFLSTSYWESFPLTLLEAQGAGLPVLCYDIYGCRDIIIHGRNGYVAGDYASLHNQLNRMITDPHTRIKKSTVQQEIRKKYDSRKIYTEIAQMFHL